MSRLIPVILIASGCGGSTTAVAPKLAAVQTTAKSVQVQFSVTVPRRTSGTARSPRYVSASTQSASIVVAPSGGSAGTPVVVNCTTVCSGQIAAPVGSDTFTMTLFDAANAGGNLLSTGSLAQTIVIDQANTVNVTFNGVVVSLTLSLSPSSVSSGTATTVTVNVAALDADKNTIVGPGSYVDANGAPLTVQLADSDTSATKLSTTTLTAPPSTAVTLSYSGAAIANPTITASATGLTSAQAILTVNAVVHTITEFATSAINTDFITTGPDGNLLVHGIRRQGRKGDALGDHDRVRDFLEQQRPVGHHDRSGRQPLVHGRRRRQGRKGDPLGDHHRVRVPGRQRPAVHHDRSGRQPLVHGTTKCRQDRKGDALGDHHRVRDFLEQQRPV